VIIVNGDETAMDRYADWLLVGQIGEILPALVGAGTSSDGVGQSS
jgi:hypothetical protein